MLLQPSLPTKAMRFFGIFAQTSWHTAGLGGSHQPSLRRTVVRTTSSLWDSISWNPLAFLPKGTFLVCLLWQSTSPFPRGHQFPKVIMSPSPPLDVCSSRRLSRLSQSLCAVNILWEGVLNLIPSLKDTPHHALPGPSHCRHMGGALALVAVSLPPLSRPQFVLGGNMPGML